MHHHHLLHRPEKGSKVVFVAAAGFAGYNCAVGAGWFKVHSAGATTVTSFPVPHHKYWSDQ